MMIFQNHLLWTLTRHHWNMHLFQTVLSPKKDQDIFQSRVVPSKNPSRQLSSSHIRASFCRCSCFPRVNFPSFFSLSDNSKHFSNTQESLKSLDETIIPYVEKEWEALNLDKNQPALLIIDVFSGQVTKPVIDKMTENNVKIVKVPANKNQPLDLTVNGAAKAYMKKRFTEWYSRLSFKSLTVVMVLITLTYYWRCRYSNLSCQLDKQPLQLFHSIRRKENYSQRLEGCIYHRSLTKR